MTKSKKYSLLILGIVVLLIAFIAIRVKSSQKINHYQLYKNYYLHKNDYFSSYSISKHHMSGNIDIITRVEDIAVNQEHIVIRYSKENSINYMLVKKDTIILDIRDIDSIGLMNSKIDFIKPWQFVEKKTLKDKNKLLSQIILIGILILGFFLIMNVFKIERLK